jgi:YCII-related domain
MGSIGTEARPGVRNTPRPAESSLVNHGLRALADRAGDEDAFFGASERGRVPSRLLSSKPSLGAATGSATVIDNRGEEAMFTDGPFLESKEYLAGFWIMEAADLDVALKLAAEGSKACNRKIEVRPFL